MKPMHLACGQFDIAWEDKPANYRRVAALVAAAKLPPGTLLLLPEMFATGFTMRAESVAEPVGGSTAQFLAELARQHAIFVQAGVVLWGEPEQSPEDRAPVFEAEGCAAPSSRSATARCRNEALVFDPAGRLLACYAKIHLFSPAGEPEHYAPGRTPTLFTWREATVAPAICYDLRFPELFRAATCLGAEILTVIACWPAAREAHWLTLLAARAIENQCYVAAANRCGQAPTGLTYSGRSQIIDPTGVVLVDAGSDEGVIQAELDLAALRRYRHAFPALRGIAPAWEKLP